jgi:hypothetical protein
MRQLSDDRVGRLTLAARRIGVDVTTAEVLRAFRDAGCRSLLIKGPAMEREFWDEGSYRHYNDCDLLVAEADLDRAAAALSGAGFALVLDHRGHPGIDEPHAQEWSLKGSSDRSVDLHWRFPGIGAPPNVAWEVLTERTQPIVVAGADGETLDRAGLTLLVALHAAHHGTMRTTPLDDLERALDRLDIHTWAQARALASRLDALEAFTAGLQLSPAGEPLVRALELPDVTSPRVRLSATRQAPGSFGVLDILEAPSAWARLRVLRTALVPSPTYMRATSALARRGRAGLVLAYLARGLDRTRQLPAALRAVRRARRPLSRA